MSKPIITLYQLEISPFCDKVRRVLTYKKLDYEVRNVAMGGLSKMKKLSPIGKLPIIDIDGKIIADSSDICRELERLFPEPSIYPSDKKELAQVHILEDWADESLYFFEMTMRFTWKHDRKKWVKEILKYDNALMKQLGRLIVPYLTRKQGQGQGIANRSEATVLAELRLHIESIEALAKAGYLVGEQLSLADISVLSQLECLAGCTLGHALLNEYPNVIDWMARMNTLTGE